MNKEEIKETPIWHLYEKGVNFGHSVNRFQDTDRNYRMYNGDQWAGAILGDIEPVQINFIKSIVKYKVSVIHDNLYGIVYESMNFDNEAFRETAESVCEMLTNYASRVWELDQMDIKCRRATMDSAINSEGIVFIDFDEDQKIPKTEVIKKNDIFFGNENDDDIQSQPYILIKKRLPVASAIEFALRRGLAKDKTEFIISDNDTFDEAGDDAKKEVDDMVTIVYKFYREDKTVKFSIATKWITICEDKNLGISTYPISHYVWEEKCGSARGEGEVKNLIPNQLEVNKTQMRRVLTARSQAYPHLVVDESKIANADDLDNFGSIIRTKGNTVDDVRKLIGTVAPATMSPDVKVLLDELIQMSRELAGAGEAATGQIDAGDKSGRAILAIQQASRAPLTSQKLGFRIFVEDIARIWLEYIIAHSQSGFKLQRKVTDQQTGKEYTVIETVAQETLKQLRAHVKIEITPKSVYDRLVLEQTLENLLTMGLLSAQRVGELEIYAHLLPDDSVAPKRAILEAVKMIKENQRKIAKIQADSQLMQQRANSYITEGPEAQAEDLSRQSKKNYLMKLLQSAAAQKNKNNESAAMEEDKQDLSIA